jgi:hypothetical protein
MHQGAVATGHGTVQLPEQIYISSGCSGHAGVDTLHTLVSWLLCFCKGNCNTGTLALQASNGRIQNSNVLASDLCWLPAGSEYPVETNTHFSASQSTTLTARAEAVHGDILLCKLAPGQRIELEAHAVRGQGWDHAKFSPVATAWHRLFPELVIKKVRL